MSCCPLIHFVLQPSCIQAFGDSPFVSGFDLPLDQTFYMEPNAVLSETCGSLYRNRTHVFLQSCSSYKASQQLILSEMRCKKTCSLSGLDSESLFNQSPFPLINEWLQEAAYQVAEPIDWRTFGVVKSVSLIRVNLPSLSTFTTLKQTAQRKSLFLFRTQFACLVKGTRTLNFFIHFKPKL